MGVAASMPRPSRGGSPMLHGRRTIALRKHGDICGTPIGLGLEAAGGNMPPWLACLLFCLSLLSFSFLGKKKL